MTLPLPPKADGLFRRALSAVIRAREAQARGYLEGYLRDRDLR